MPSNSSSDSRTPIIRKHPEPEVKWLSPREFKREFGYVPGQLEETVRDEVLERILEGRRLTITEDRLEAFRRVAALWNGGCVGPQNVHLLVDRIPSWDEVFAGLSMDELEAFRPEVKRLDEELIDAFGDQDWFEPELRQRGWMKTSYIGGLRARYDIEERARTLINERNDLPDLRGDPFEGLPHRVAVGLEAVRATYLNGHEVETYPQFRGYTPDLLKRTPDGRILVTEVLIDHHNNQLYRDTYAKLVSLDKAAVLVFDTRDTARRVLNHWESWEADVPGAPFGSALRMDWVRQKFSEAADDPSQDWLVKDVLTIKQLWGYLSTVLEHRSPQEIMTHFW
ncbi:hypothetical protein [Haloarchaeobius sp. DT45]|uniref:hypothetical protein n=1 Tax=Haloarchaeobius sp. DT45 TaxID=3446116 RepID=UPI003F6B8D05